MCSTTPPELPPQPIPAPVPVPVAARSYPPSPSVKTIEEVEHKQVYKPLQDNKQIRRKLDAAKKIPTRQAPSFEKCIRWSPELNNINMLLSRDEVWMHSMPLR